MRCNFINVTLISPIYEIASTVRRFFFIYHALYSVVSTKLYGAQRIVCMNICGVTLFHKPRRAACSEAHVFT